MYKKQTEFDLEQLSGFIPFTCKCNNNTSSFELPTISVITSEIGIIFITAIKKVDRINAENKLIELLDHSSCKVRQIAYFFLSEYLLFSPQNLSQGSSRALHEFEKNESNKEIIDSVRAVM